MQMNVFDHNTFLDAFYRDLRDARNTVMLHSAYISLARAEKMVDVLAETVARGIRMCVFIQEQDEWERQSLSQSERAKVDQIMQAMQTFKKGGVHVTTRPQEHIKIAVIDNYTVWDGSLNITSHNPKRTNERMTRRLSLYWCMEAIVRHKLNHCPDCADWVQGRSGREIMINTKTIGKMVEALRVEQGLSQEGLAHKAGINRAAVWRLETEDEYSPRLETIVKIFDALEQRLSALPFSHAPFIEQLLLMSPDR